MGDIIAIVGAAVALVLNTGAIFYWAGTLKQSQKTQNDILSNHSKRISALESKYVQLNADSQVQEQRIHYVERNVDKDIS